jgi:hypothetical protein
LDICVIVASFVGMKPRSFDSKDGLSFLYVGYWTIIEKFWLKKM